MRFTHLMDLPPCPGNPRNSEGSFLPLPEGRTLFIYSRFSQGLQDDATADLYRLVLDRDHRVVAQGPVLLAADEGAKNLMSVSMLPLENGDAGLFYLRRVGETGLQLFLRRSSDGGESWSAAVCATPRAGYFVVNNDRVLRLGDGSILVPAAEHKKALRADGSVFLDTRAEDVFFLSRDDGRTFVELPGKCCLPCTGVCQSGLQEPGVIELRSGEWWCWARTDLGRQYEMFSRDQGRSWSAPAPSAFTSPLAPLSMRRLRDGRLLAVYDPMPLYDGRPDTVEGIWTGGRTPLVYRVSEDDGVTFSAPVTLEDGPGSGYCYTALREEDDGRILMAYCAGGPGDGNCLTRLRLALLALD